MKILLPVDGSTAALVAVRHALTLAEQGLDCDFVLVNVQEPPSLYEVVVAHDADVIQQVRGAAGADLLRDAEAMLEAAGHAWEAEVVGGQPAAMIVELAENYGCDAIVMGACGIGDGDGLGSVARAVIELSPLPVTVVRAQPAEEPPPADE
ncbi:MAG: universal stress protein [Rubrivivax sp.]|nr:universal stress protein [Rubrivivax sp.]MCW5612177.1 universal stress protein [Rubrivivax sp.]